VGKMLCQHRAVVHNRLRYEDQCCLGWLKESRAVATRFDKLARNYLATVKLAVIRRYLRLLDSSDRA
jgi:hypothetical protein